MDERYSTTRAQRIVFPNPAGPLTHSSFGPAETSIASQCRKAGRPSIQPHVPLTLFWRESW